MGMSYKFPYKESPYSVVPAVIPISSPLREVRIGLTYTMHKQ
jgi:hypothetical protein